ncbi:CRISPR-associated protein Csb1 [Kitasatospora sp. GP30]|uniref:type I-G CRISPR-associated RAMP protein Csb1/Cas7g n=1 Tax=Kitasatospora sp. GP30 TaxID=3035084 RepID=UPI000C70FEA6|nr:type I-U CRISPR-associated RAMP protein Csb1/Cas7u [Kitasatospora sp. GP30]MDH6145895.1 CRISPR-associated protein Csb1 [Kitasatospora sp. GP30]
MEALYERLLQVASGLSRDGAVRVVGHYEPVAGAGTPVAPPTVKVKRTVKDLATGKDKEVDEPGQLFEDRWVDEKRTEVVLLDQRQSQANRCETALLEAVDQGEVLLPHLALHLTAEGRELRMTNLDAPHRSRDAYFRDAIDESGTKFDDTETGRALRDTGTADVRAFLASAPSDLVYGIWDSHRKRRVQLKVPRTYTSELVGLHPLRGQRAAGRFDVWNFPGDTVELTGDGWRAVDGTGKKGKGKTLRASAVGHGMIPPAAGMGGVTVQTIERNATLAMAGLRALRFGDAPREYVRAARALLAALALLGDRLAFAAPAVRLRSGCDLLLVSERIEWVGRGREGVAVTEPLELDTVAQALELFEYARSRAEEAGLKWSEGPVRLRPNAQVQQAIERSFRLEGIGEAEGE